MDYTIFDVERFLAKVKVADSSNCWEWIATKKSYGEFRLNKKMVKAHRFAYRIYNGPFDPLLCVLHSCDNPGCVNPFHLSLGTHLDNMVDMRNKGRSTFGLKNKKNTSGYPGVDYYKPTGKYRASILIGQKRKHLGYFDTPELASASYEQAKARYSILRNKL